MFRLHWGDCKDEIANLTTSADSRALDLKLKALEFELVRQERDDFRKKYAELLEQSKKQEKQICNLELYTKELETRLSYVKPHKELKEYKDRRDECMKNKRAPRSYPPKTLSPLSFKRNKSSILADLLS